MVDLQDKILSLLPERLAVQPLPKYFGAQTAPNKSVAENRAKFPVYFETKKSPEACKPEENAELPESLKGKGYSGQVNAAGLREGGGLQQFKNGSAFDGFFVQDKMVEGRLFFHNGDIYTGPITDERRVTIEYISPYWKYAGSFECGKFVEGYLKWKKNSVECVYFGKFYNDRFQGQGKLTLDGVSEVYEGQWENGFFCGKENSLADYFQTIIKGLELQLLDLKYAA